MFTYIERRERKANITDESRENNSKPGITITLIDKYVL
jgi:hypothetical protein